MTVVHVVLYHENTLPTSPVGLQISIEHLPSRPSQEIPKSESEIRIGIAKEVFKFFEAVQYDPVRFLDPTARFDPIAAVSRANRAWREHIFQSILGLNSNEIKKLQDEYFGEREQGT